MRLLIDISSIPDGNNWNTGLERYALTILEGFKKLELEDIHILTTDKRKEEIETLFPSFKVLSFKRFPRIFLLDKPKWYRDSFKWRKAINNSGCDMVFLPFLGKKFDFRKINKPFVLTVHDLQLYRMTKPLRLFIIKAFQYPIMVRRANGLIAISEYVKKDVASFFNVPEDKIKVIHNAVKSPDIEGTVPFDEKEKYILTVNSLYPHKNIITLLRAFNLIKNQVSHKLVIVGRTTEHWNKVLYKYIKDNDLTNRVTHLENLEYDVLTGLYKHADLFVSTSLMEGFGYTPVEAAIAGAKVLSTKETSLPESTMGLVNYYEPATDPLALSQKIMDCLSDNNPLRLDDISLALKKEYDNVKRAADVYSFLKETYEHSILN